MEKVTSDTAKLGVDDNAADRKLLIAVDFGTTYSGVAWAQTRRVSDRIDRLVITTSQSLTSSAA